MKYTVIVLFLSAGFSFAADDDASKKLLKDLEGSYKVTSGEHQGEPVPARFYDDIEKISIKGDKMTTTFKREGGKSETQVVTIVVDATKKPAYFDRLEDAAPKLGIIVIDGETIKICHDREASDKKRPTEFKASKDDKNVLVTLKKIKE